MPRALLIASFVLGAATTAAAAVPETMSPDTIEYEIGWENPASQLYVVRATAAASGEPVVFSLPAWRPGRYILQNYVANVQNVRAVDPSGRPLAVSWVDLDTWSVEPGGAGRVTLIYEYYAATFDGGSSTLRPDLAYFNPVNLLPWVEGRMDQPARLTIQAPADWAVATQLERAGGDGHVFTAPDYHALADAPTIAAPDIEVWPFDVDGVRFHAVFLPQPELHDRERSRIEADLAAIAREEAAIFGGRFPFDEYHHLYQLVPYPFGHAVEHASSASYVLQDRIFANDGDNYLAFLAVSAHELFHAWNVKRIRPAALWPYDYSEPQLSRLHWWTEGVTAYYEELVLVRAELMPHDEYYRGLGRSIQNLESTPGRRVTSAEMASWTSWLTGYGAGNPNQTVSFYGLGAMLGLLLDLQIRDATDGARGLDDVFRLLWERYHERGQGVPEDGIQKAVEEVAGRSFEDFFARHVRGTEPYPYAESLAVVGLEARRVEDPDRPAATVGLALRGSAPSVTVANVLPESPALAAGVLRGDVVRAVDGEELESADLAPVLAEREPGDTLTLRLVRGGRELDVEVQLVGGANLRWEVRPMEDASERQTRLREGWLASQAR